jgi:hypothetical protein
MLKFFDCNASIGEWKHPRFGAIATADELEQVLDYLEVECAIVFHAHAQEGHAPLGNAMLMRELAGHPRLLPSWVLLSHYTGEMPEPKVLVKEMTDRGVRLARLFPGASGHGFSLEPWCADKLLSELAIHRIPVMIDFTLGRRDFPDWKVIHSLCQRHPALPIILTGAGIGRASRSFFPMLQVCPNLYIELSRYTSFRCVDGICERYGARRLIYGSGLPLVAPGVAMTTVTHALIDDEEKAQIASANLERLLSEVVV